MKTTPFQQGDDGGQYYHLTLSEFSIIVTLSVHLAARLNITEQLGFEQEEGDDGDGAVLVHRSVVALQPGRKVGQVVGDLLDHQLPHLAAPDRLGRVVLPEKIVANFSGPWLSR